MTARRWTKRALSFRADRWLTLTSPPPIASLNFSKIYNLKTIFNKFTTISDGSRPDSHILWFETINAPEMVYSRPYTTSCGLILQNHLGVVSRLIEETALCMTFYFTAYLRGGLPVEHYGCLHGSCLALGATLRCAGSVRVALLGHTLRVTHVARGLAWSHTAPWVVKSKNISR